MTRWLLILLLLVQPALADVRFKTKGASFTLVAGKEADKFKLLDGKGKTVATYKLKKDLVLVSDGQHKEVYKLKRKPDGFDVRGPDTKGKRLFLFRRKDKTDWNIADGREVRVMTVRLRKGAYELDDKAVSKVRLQGDKLAFLDKAGKGAGELTGSKDLEAGLWMGVGRFDPALRGGLFLYLSKLDH
ncbi:MAG: hypothetical protein KC910_21640 [Candidatus Eremiobacteraeota bacterium]|nr:hypothetical protein [Candidatus Eremiobacteraeota bacterium]